MSRNRLVQWTAILVAAFALLIVAGVTGTDVETEAERIQRLSYSYACPECKGQSVAESNAAVSLTIRDFINESVASGATDQEIRDDLLRGYGERVLLNPPSDGFSSLLWVLPVIFVVVGAAGIVAFTTRETSAEPDAPDGDEPNTGGAQPIKSSPRQADQGQGRSPTKIAVAIAGVVALAGGAGYLMAQASGERGADDALTGNIDESLRDKVLECEQLGFAGETLDALECFDVVLKEDPQNAEALTYRGWFVALAANSAAGSGETDAAVELFASAQASLSAAIEIEPSYPDPRALRGVMYNWIGQPELACEDFAVLDTLEAPQMILGLTEPVRERIGCPAP